MKIGIKLWSTNSDLYEDFIELYNKKLVDYLEIKYIPGHRQKLNLLKKNNIPIILHTQNYMDDGTCFSSNEFEKNKKLFQEILEVADLVNAEGIIMHPEVGTEENFVKFLKSIDSSKIIIENMPQKSFKGTAIGFDFNSLKKFIEAGKCRFCLDFCHAIKSAAFQGVDYKAYVEKLLELKPYMFHICDGHSTQILDEHLNLGEGDFNLKFLKSKIMDKPVTLEVPKKDGLNNDIKNINFFKKITI